MQKPAARDAAGRLVTAHERSFRSNQLFDHALTLATATSHLRDLLALLDRRLHVMTPLLQLAQQTFCGQLALQVLDGSFNPFAVDDDLKGLALYGFARIRQGTGNLSDPVSKCKSRNRPIPGTVWSSSQMRARNHTFPATLGVTTVRVTTVRQQAPGDVRRRHDPRWQQHERGARDPEEQRQARAEAQDRSRPAA
jgi:hypothetical protein